MNKDKTKHMRTFNDVEVGEECVTIKTNHECLFKDSSCEFNDSIDVCTKDTISISRLMRKDQGSFY